jgi:hypothetical protein
MTGDKITMAVDLTGGSANDAGLALAAEATAVPVTVVSAGVFTYQVSETTGFPTTAVVDASIEGLTEFTVATYGDAPAYQAGRVFAGAYTAQAYVLTVAEGVKLTSGTVAVSTASATLSTAGSASVQGIQAADNTSNKTIIKAATTSVTMTVQALDAAKVAVSAGRPVVITATAWANAAAAVGTFKINGLSSPVTVYTDAAGQVSFAVTETAGLATAQVRIQAVVEGAVTVGADLDWATTAYTLVDYGTTAGTISGGAAIARTITSKGSYTLDLAVADQWFQGAPAATYRVVVTGSGVTEKIHTLSANGRAAVVVTDSGITAVGGNFTSSVVLQKLTGTTWAATSTHTVTTTVSGAPAVVLAADGSNLYQPTSSSLVSDLSDLVAAKALVEIDTRSETTAAPAYLNDVIVQGVVRSTTTSVGTGNAYVTISGPSNILFTNGSVSARGSLTFLSQVTTGEFEVTLHSTSAQTDSVITVTSMGTSSTTKVSFTGAGIGEGTALVVTMPAAVKPASTFQVKAKLADVYGNGVNTVAGSMKVTYTGAGIVFGTLPTETDANGELMFSVLLGSNDTGSVNVTVSYDQNADGDYLDVKDLVTAGTTAITASGEVASDTKVNVGTFSGKLVVYALNAAGSEVSYKIAGKWVTQVVTSDLLQRYDRVVGATGKTIKVDIYVDGVLKLAKSVVTK